MPATKLFLCWLSNAAAGLVALGDSEGRQHFASTAAADFKPHVSTCVDYAAVAGIVANLRTEHFGQYLRRCVNTTVQRSVELHDQRTPFAFDTSQCQVFAQGHRHTAAGAFDCKFNALLGCASKGRVNEAAATQQRHEGKCEGETFNHCPQLACKRKFLVKLGFQRTRGPPNGSGGGGRRWPRGSCA